MERRTVLMITQDVEVTRRILQEAHSLTDAGYVVRILTRSPDERDGRGTVDGLPVEWVAVRGRDSRFRWLYRLAGVARGTQAAALWSVLTGRHTFTMRALPRAVSYRADIYHAHDLNNLEVAYRAARRHNARLVYDAHELFPEMANRWVRLRKGYWSRLEARLLPRADLAITVNELIAEETARRLSATTPQWPIMHAVLHGVGRDQLMARHKANHVNVVYAPDAATADKAMRVKAAMFDELGVRVHLCGEVNL